MAEGNTINMIYIDESGVPGLANNSRDYFIVSLVIINSETKSEEIRHKIENLRIELKLPEDYEFHSSRNSIRVQKAFLALMHNLNFKFITVALKKTNRKNDVTYRRMATLLADKLKDFKTIKVEMDSNPMLYIELKKALKNSKIKVDKIRQRNSKSSRLVQLADYVVSASGKKVKNTPKSDAWFDPISSKCISLVIE